MIPAKFLIERRNNLRKLINEGIIILPANKLKPKNYRSNTYKFRQDSSFYYFTGINRPDLFLIIDVDNDSTYLFGNDYDEEDYIWMGIMPKLKDLADNSGIDNVEPLCNLKDFIVKRKKSKIHYLPIYSDDILLHLSLLLDENIEKINNSFSHDLIKAIFKLRSIKDAFEIENIENTLNNVTYNFFVEIMKITKPGLYEYDLRAIIEKIVISKNCYNAFEPICTVHGEILHNNNYSNMLKDGQLLLVDAGAESAELYATDITRTIPVSGKFSDIQKEVYEIVLKAQIKAIESIRPGVKYYEIHKNAVKVITEGLINLKLMKGNIEDIIEECAYALFFPHGIGHMLGMDVHDMESFGEDIIGYDENIKRSNKFGLKYLRYAKELVAGNVFTIEPGIYFNKFLIEKWQRDNKFRNFINYSLLEKYNDFGGLRIEDDILVTQDGYRVLGKPIPKTIEEIESIMN